MISSDSLVDLMVAGLLAISWVRLLSIAHRLNVLFFSGSILHVKCVGDDCVFDLGDSSSPARCFKKLLVFPHCCRLAFVLLLFPFFFNCTVITSC